MNTPIENSYSGIESCSSSQSTSQLDIISSGEYIWLPVRSTILHPYSTKVAFEKERNKENRIKVDELKQVTFRTPVGVYILGEMINRGRYGNIWLAKDMPPEGNRRPPKSFFDYDYVIKGILDQNAVTFELKAYEHIERTLRVPEKASRNGQYKSEVELYYGLSKRSIMLMSPFVAPLLGYRQSLLEHFQTKNRTEYKDETVRILNPEVLRPLPPGTFLCCMLLFHNETGGDLENLLLRWLQRPMTIMEAIFYITEIAEALLWLHEIGIVHQDITGSNILIQSDGHIRLTDFGQACVVPGGSGLPYKGNIACSNAHMPPEIADRKPGSTSVWHAADWFSLGVLLHRLLSHGHYPCVQSSKIGFSPIVEIIPDYCHAFLTGLLCPNPVNRLGGDLKFGGKDVLSHPGLIKPLLGPTRTKGTLKTAGSSLSAGLRNAMADNTVKLSFADVVAGRLTSPVSKNRIPIWMENFRGAIRNRILLPPFVPSTTTANKRERVSCEHH